MKKIFAIIYCYSICAPVLAQTDFSKTFSFGKLSDAHKVIQTSDSGFVVCGSTRDTNTLFAKIFLLKLDKNGDSLWSRKYGPFSEPGIGGVFQVNNGDFIIGFDTHVTGYDNYLNFLKTNENGDSLLYIPADSSFSGGRLRGGESENIYVSGARGWYDYYDYGNFYSIALLRKYDKNLQLIWEKQLQSDQFGPPAFGDNVLLNDQEEITTSGGFMSIPFGPIINEVDSSGTITWYLGGSDIASFGCMGAGVSIGRANGGIIFSVTVPFTSNVLLTNLDSMHSMLWQKQIFLNPVFFQQWNNGNITIVNYDFGYMDINQGGDSIDINEENVLPYSSVSDAIKCYDECLMMVGTDCWYCTNQREAYIVKTCPAIVGIDEHHLNSEAESIFLFPNPADKKIELTFSSPIQSVTLFSTNGKPISQFNHLYQSKFILDVSGLTSGIYFVSASSNDKIYREKIFVTH